MFERRLLLGTPPIVLSDGNCWSFFADDFFADDFFADDFFADDFVPAFPSEILLYFADGEWKFT